MLRYSIRVLASLELEERGIHFDSRVVPRAVRRIAANRRPWVARILGPCSRYGLERVFLSARRDYSGASRSGRSGIKHWFFLEPGIYEVFAVLSTTRTRRYFVESRAGELREIEREEVDAWIESGSDH